MMAWYSSRYELGGEGLNSMSTIDAPDVNVSGTQEVAPFFRFRFDPSVFFARSRTGRLFITLASA